MAELSERARQVRKNIMDHTRSEGVVPTTAELCRELGLSAEDLAVDLLNLEAAASVARQDSALFFSAPAAVVVAAGGGASLAAVYMCAMLDATDVEHAVVLEKPKRDSVVTAARDSPAGQFKAQGF